MSSFDSTAFASTISDGPAGLGADLEAVGDGNTIGDAPPRWVPVILPLVARLLTRWSAAASTGGPLRVRALLMLVRPGLATRLDAAWKKFRRRGADEWVAMLLPLPDTIDDGTGVRFARWGPLLTWSGVAAAVLFAGGATASVAIGGWLGFIEFLAFTFFAVSLILSGVVGLIALVVVWFVMR